MSLDLHTYTNVEMCSFSIYPFSILNQVGIKTCKLNNTIFPIDSPLNFTFFKQLKILQIPQLDLMQNLFSPTEMISFILQVCRIADEANCTISTCMVAVVLQDNILIHIQFLHKSTTYEQSYYDISLWYEFEWLEAGSIFWIIKILSGKITFGGGEEAFTYLRPWLSMPDTEIKIAACYFLLVI